MDERGRQRQFEDQFLGQLRTRALALTKGALPADRVLWEPTPDGYDAVRDALIRLELYDRNLLETLPGTHTQQLRFQRSVLGGLFRRTVSRVRVQTLISVDALVNGQAPGPVGREQVLDAKARFELLPRDQRPSAVVFASPTGFTPEARMLAQMGGPPTLVLLGGRPDGGWDVDLPDALRKTAWAKLFDLESQDERLKRLLYHLEQNAGVVDSRGLPVSELAEKLGLTAAQTQELVQRACRTDSRLMTVPHAGVLHVCRTPLGEEGHTMSLWSRIRKLLRLKPTVAERVREMTGQRVRLEQQRHEVDQRMNMLEAQEREAIQQGAAAAGDAERKQVAGRLMRIRKDLQRQRAQANVFTQQIDILGTHIHHLTLSEQGRRFELPKAEDLTREAAQAEQVMGELQANADLAARIEVGAQSPMMQEEEAAIMAEFKQVAATKAATPAGDKTAQSAGPAAARAGAPAAATTPPPPVSKQRESAKPEIS